MNKLVNNLKLVVLVCYRRFLKMTIANDFWQKLSKSHNSLYPKFKNMRFSQFFLMGCFLLFLSSCVNENNREEAVEDDFFEQETTELEQPNEPSRSSTGISKTYSFDVEKETYSIELTLEERLFNYFEKQPKVYTYTSRELPEDWEVDYYNMFVDNRNDKSLINDILYQLNDLKTDMSENELLNFVVNFVQGGLAYDWDSYFDVTDELSYPYETLFSKKGVCSDKSLVLGKLLAKLGYEAVFLTFAKANHMAVGVRVPDGYGNFGTKYAYIETTNYSSIGRIPKQFVGGIKIEEPPLIIPIENDGQKVFEGIIDFKNEENRLQEKYGEAYTHASANEKILLEEMHDLNIEINNLKNELNNDGCEGIVSPQKMKSCTALQKRINQRVDTYNRKVKRYNSMNKQPES